jgi:hypothetical protein
MLPEYWLSMSPRLSLFVLSAFLILLLPLPVYLAGSGLLPAARIIMLVFSQSTVIYIVILLTQGLTACLVCIVISRLYVGVSKSWPLKIRGSGVGIISLLLILIFSSISVYKPFGDSSQDRLEFRQLYYW